MRAEWDRNLSLIDQLGQHAMDEDYDRVAHRSGRREPPQAPRRAPRPGVAALLVVAVFGLLLITAAVQTSRNAAIVEEGRGELVSLIRARSAQVEDRRTQTADLREEVAGLQERAQAVALQEEATTDAIERLGVPTGWLAVTGPGVKVVVDDAPNATEGKQQVLDKDLQLLVNGLWESGAEAVAVNGQRVTALTAIRQAGSAIGVNYVSLSAPYTVTAIGDPDSLPARFVETQAGASWLDLQAAYGLTFEITSEESLTLPAVDRLPLRLARPAPSPGLPAGSSDGAGS
jgi:uncharacterized protein YlxW (UPF0749 family)